MKSQDDIHRKVVAPHQDKADRIDTKFSALEKELSTLNEFESKNRVQKDDIGNLQEEINQESLKRGVI